MVVFGEVHHLLIDIQPVNPRRSSTFLFLVPNQRSIKVARPSSVSPLLVKGKAYVLFSWKSVNMVSDVDFISMSRNGQLTGFCHALPKTESRDLIRRSKQTLFIWKLWKTPLRPLARKAIRKTLKNPNVNRKISHGQKSHENCSLPRGGGGTPLYKYIGMCRPKGYGF